MNINKIRTILLSKKGVKTVITVYLSDINGLIYTYMDTPRDISRYPKELASLQHKISKNFGVPYCQATNTTAIYELKAYIEKAFEELDKIVF